MPKERKYWTNIHDVIDYFGAMMLLGGLALGYGTLIVLTIKECIL